MSFFESGITGKRLQRGARKPFYRRAAHDGLGFEPAADLMPSSIANFFKDLCQLPWLLSRPLSPSIQTNLLSRSPSRKGIPGKYREVAKPAGGRGALYVAALEEKEKTRRHAQTEPGRAIPWELREEHAEGSRTHYLAGPGTHWINQQKFWRVKNKVGRGWVFLFAFTVPLRPTHSLRSLR